MQSTRFRLPAALVGVAAISLAAYACGGSASSAPGGTTGDEAGGGGGGSGAGGAGGLSPSCPSTAPANGVACSSAGLECEYGEDLSLDCNAVATCGDGQWRVTTPKGSPSCPTSNAAACPASKAAARQGDTCTENNLTCTYPNGECRCGTSCGQLPEPGFMPCEAGAPTTWMCSSTPQIGCPEVRPRLGASCAVTDPPGIACDYAELPCKSTSYVCQSGTWRSKHVPCLL